MVKQTDRAVAIFELEDARLPWPSTQISTRDAVELPCGENDTESNSTMIITWLATSEISEIE